MPAKLLAPVEGYRISQYFGENPEYYAQWGLKGHNGLDYACPTGTKVRAPCSGVIEFAGWSKTYGLFIRLWSTDRFYFICLAHLSALFVVTGDLCDQGEVLALSGNTGNSTGDHLHFGVYIPSMRNAFGHNGPIDPLLALGGDDVHSKICPHIQLPHHERWLKEAIKTGRVPYTKMLDPDRGESDPYGGYTTQIGRLTFPNNADTKMVGRGRQGALEWAEAVRPRIAKCPWISIWELPNEFVIGSNEDVDNYIAFTFEAVYQLQAMWESGFPHFKITAAPFSTGNPPAWAWKDIGTIFGPATAAPADIDRLGCVHYGNTHEYGMRHMYDLKTEGHLLRYRAAFRELAIWGHRIPPWFLSETGIDFSGNGETDGWRKHTASYQEYLSQLAGFDEEVVKDTKIQGIFPFTHMAEGSWPSFAIDRKFTEDYLVPYWVRKAYSDTDLYGEWIQQFVLPRNVDSAFNKYAKQTNPLWEMMSPEVDHDGYRFQVWYSAKDNMQHIVSAKIGDWGNIKHFDRSN